MNDVKEFLGSLALGALGGLMLGFCLGAWASTPPTPEEDAKTGGIAWACMANETNAAMDLHLMHPGETLVYKLKPGDHVCAQRSGWFAVVGGDL